MKNRKLQIMVFILLLLFSLSVGTVSAQDSPRVRAFLFYSPTCSHCHKVITEDLPPLFDQYGDQLYILGIDVTTEIGGQFFTAVLEQIQYTESAGVPFLLVGDIVMVGSEQIPAELPALIEESLAKDGIPWPDIPAVQEFLFAQGFIDADGNDIVVEPEEAQPTEEPTTIPTETPQNTPQPAETDTPQPTEPVPSPTTPEREEISKQEAGFTVLDENGPGFETGSMLERFNRDIIANGTAVVVLLIMIAVVVWIGTQFMKAATPKPWPNWILPVLLVVGLGIAIYLSLIEVSGETAICGPVGDCNAVQQSEYSKVFGVVPVAVLGMLGYITIGITWVVSLKTSGKLQFYAKMAMFLVALFGLLFFIYLTFLEPFVIGATCAWCISSAIIMTLINIFATRLALDAWSETDDDFYDDDEVGSQD